MAFELDDINAGVKQYVIPVVVDNIFDRIFLLKRLLKRKRVEAVYGRDLTRQPVILGKYETYGHSNKYDPIQVQPTNILSYATLGYHTRYTSIAITRDEKKKIQGKNAVIDLIKVKTVAAVMSLVEAIEQRLLTQIDDTDTLPINSLEKIIDNGSKFAEYGGINRAEVPQWRAQFIDKGNTALTYQDLSDMFQACQWNVSSPTLVITTAKLWTKINTLIYDKQRILLDKDIDLGVPNFKLFGAPVVSSPFVSPGTILFVNEDYLSLFVDKEGDKDGVSFMPFKEVDMSNELLVGKWIVDMQLFSPAPRMHGKIVNVLEE